MKVIIDKWKNGGYSRVDEYPTKAEFIKVVFEMEMPVTDGLEYSSDFFFDCSSLLHRTRWELQNYCRAKRILLQARQHH